MRNTKTSIFLNSTLTVIFAALSALHFSWALGYSWGFRAALPTTSSGQFLFEPQPIDSAIVGFGLLAFAVFYLLQLNGLALKLNQKFNKIISWFIPSIFLLRAIGDFKYVGIFKPPMDTAFASADFYIYSPICLFIALFGYLIANTED